MERPHILGSRAPFLVGVLECFDQIAVEKVGRLGAKRLCHGRQDAAFWYVELRASVEQVRLALGQSDGIGVLASLDEGEAIPQPLIGLLAELPVLEQRFE